MGHIKRTLWFLHGSIFLGPSSRIPMFCRRYLYIGTYVELKRHQIHVWKRLNILGFFCCKLMLIFCFDRGRVRHFFFFFLNVGLNKRNVGIWLQSCHSINANIMLRITFGLWTWSRFNPKTRILSNYLSFKRMSKVLTSYRHW